MAKDHRVQNLVVGLVFLGGLGLLGFATLMIQGLGWAEAHEITVRFPRVNNLKTGESVQIHGLPVGEITKIEYDPAADGNNIRVECTLRKGIKLTDQTEFRIKSAGPLAGKHLEIYPGKEGQVIDPGTYKGFVGDAEGDVFEKLGDLVTDTREGPGILPRMIRDRELADKAEGALDEIRSTFRRINSEDGPLLAFDEMRKTYSHINTGQGLLSAFINDTDMRDKLISTVDDLSALLKDVRESKGIVGWLISDEQARKDLEVTLSNLREFTETVGSGKGLLPRLINDEELSNNFGESLDDLHAILHKANTGVGTLGQAINNREAWDELMRILVLARESIEDLREQAPINTFANVLFAVF